MAQPDDSVGLMTRTRLAALIVAIVAPMAGCTSPDAAAPTSQTPTATTSSTTTAALTTTTTPRPTVALSDLAPLAEQASLAPNAFADLAGVMGEESSDTYPDSYALTEVCNLRLLADGETYVEHYRYWRVPNAGVTVKNIAYAYPRRTAVEVIGELVSGLGTCDEWTETDGTARKLVRNVPVERPAGLSDFVAFCQDSPDGAKRYACVAYLGHGNVVSRLSVARYDEGPRALEALRAFLPRAAQALLTP